MAAYISEAEERRQGPRTAPPGPCAFGKVMATHGRQTVRATEWSPMSAGILAVLGAFQKKITKAEDRRLADVPVERRRCSGWPLTAAVRRARAHESFSFPEGCGAAVATDPSGRRRAAP